MTIRIMGIIAASSSALAIQMPAAAQTAQPPTASQQCRRETPPQFDPKAPARPAVWTCQAAMPAKAACGRYQLYLPIWAVGRALPWERRWVAERCPPNPAHQGDRTVGS